MAVRIRLKRIGKNPRKRPYFRIAVFDETRNRDGVFIEELGFYEPVKNPPLIKINNERYDFWVKQGAKPSDTITSLVKKIRKGAKDAANTSS